MMMNQTRMKMKQILLLLSVFSLIIMAACQPAEVTKPAGGEATEDGATTVAEPAAEQIEQDLGTSDLEEIEEDLDLLVIE